MDPSIPLVKISGFWYQMVPQEFISSSSGTSEKTSSRKLVNANCPFCRDVLNETDAIKMDNCEHSCCNYCAKTGFYSKGKFYSCPLCDQAWNSCLTYQYQQNQSCSDIGDIIVITDILQLLTFCMFFLIFQVLSFLIFFK